MRLAGELVLRKIPLMKFAIVILLAVTIAGGAAIAQDQTAGRIVANYDSSKNRTTVRLAPAQFAGPKDKYDRLSFSVFYTYAGHAKRIPEMLSFELLTVVKARQLDSDLYVVFLVDGEEIFLSSDRSAVLNPVPGKRWIGERLVFRLPYETFLKFAHAKDLAVRLDGIQFDFGTEHRYSIREFERYIKQ